MPARSLEALATYTDPFAIYGATGGRRVSDSELESLKTELHVLAVRCGYPDSSRAAYTKFDSEAPGILYREMDIAASEAGRPEVWSFIGCVMAPHIVRWRFPGGSNGTSSDRFGSTRGIIRNTFGRLWWRAHIFQDHESDDRWHLLKELGEDELVQIRERTTVSGFPELAVVIAGSLVRIHAQASSPPARSELIREVMKWLVRYRSIVLFESLEQFELQSLVDTVTNLALHAMTDGREGYVEQIPDVAQSSTAQSTVPVTSGGHRSLREYLESLGLETRDRLDLGGNLWVIGDQSLESVMENLRSQGARFDLRPDGGRGTGYRPAWLFRGLDANSSLSVDS